MSMRRNVMGFGLRLLNRFAGAPAVDKLGLRKSSEKAIYQASKLGFRTASAAARSFGSIQKLVKPVRLPKNSSNGLFDLTPSEEQVMLRDAAQSFAMEKLRPAAAAADTACAAPEELLKESADLGIALMGIAEELGGAGSERSAMTNVLVAEAMAQGDMGLAVACLAPSAVSTALSLWGNEQQQAQYLPAFTGDNPPAAALAIQESRPLFDPFILQTSAKRVADGFVLQGVKSMVPLAAQAELFIIAAQLDDAGPALFIVESSVAGLTIEAEPAMGLRAASTARVVLKDVKIPSTSLIGEGAASVYTECVQLSRVAWSALATGTAQAVLDYLIPYVNERVAFGEPISHRQSVAFSIANVGIELDSMRLLTWQAASRAERGEEFAQQAALARRLCADKGVVIGSDGVQLLGGHGFIKEHPVERWYRDLRAAGMMEGVVIV